MRVVNCSMKGVLKAATASDVAMMRPPIVVDRTVFTGSKNSRKGFALSFGCNTYPRYSLPGADTTHENNTVINIARARPAGVLMIFGLAAVIQPIIVFLAMP